MSLQLKASVVGGNRNAHHLLNLLGGTNSFGCHRMAPLTVHRVSFFDEIASPGWNYSPAGKRRTDLKLSIANERLKSPQ
jgi:hypothetical protein